MSPRLAKRGRIGTVSPKTMPPRSAKRARIGKVSSKTIPLRSAKRARIDKVSPKTKEAAVKAEEVVVSVFEAKGENKVEEVIENKPNVVAQGVYEALELRDGGFDYLGKSVIKGKRFSEVMKKRIEMRNYVEWPLVNRLDCFMVLVHRAHSKKYTMDEDPLTEMKKQYPNFRWNLLGSSADPKT